MIYGARVADARRYLGETQKHFALAVGLAQSRLSAIERAGGIEVTDDVVMALAEHTGFPPEWFQRRAVPGVDEVQFRARLTFRATDRYRAIACADIVHESYAVMRGKLENLTVQLPRLLSREPRAAARHVRELFGIPSGPIPHLTLPLERQGIVLLALPIVAGKHDAFSWWDREGRYPVIATMAGGPGDRLRWSIAHELGHLVMHAAESGKEIEREADDFAAELLTPTQSMDLEIPAAPKLSALYALKMRWGVSVQSLVRRARELGRLTDDQYMGMFRQISARGERMNERYRLDREKPRLYRRMAEVLYGAAPLEGLAAATGWTAEFTREVLDQYATSAELPSRRQLIREHASPETGNVISLANRSSRRAAT